MRRLLLMASAIVFVDTMFYAAIAPLLPHLTDEFGLSKGEAGVLTGSYAAGTLVAALPGGWLAARIGVRRTVLIGLGLMSASSVAFALSNDASLLVGARFIEGVGGAASWAGALAWLIRSGPAERRGELIGSALAAAIVGGLFGPVLGALADGVGRGPVFSVVAALGVGLAIWAARMPAPEIGERPSFAGLGRALRDPRVRIGGWLVMVPGLIGGTVGVLVPLRLDSFGAGAATIAAVFLVAAALEAVVAPMAGKLSDRHGRIGLGMVGLGAGLLAAIVLPIPQTTWLLFVVAALAVPLIGVIWSPAMAMLSEGAEGVGLDQALAAGLTNFTWGVGQLLGSSGGSRIGDSFGDTWAYVSLAAICALTLLVLARRISIGRGLPEGLA